MQVQIQARVAMLLSSVPPSALQPADLPDATELELQRGFWEGWEYVPAQIELPRVWVLSSLLQPPAKHAAEHRLVPATTPFCPAQHAHSLGQPRVCDHSAPEGPVSPSQQHLALNRRPRVCRHGHGRGCPEHCMCRPHTWPSQGSRNAFSRAAQWLGQDMIGSYRRRLGNICPWGTACSGA